MPRRQPLLDELVHADGIDAHAEGLVAAALALRATDRAAHVVNVPVGVRDLEGIVVGNTGVRRNVRRKLARVCLVGRALNGERAAIGRTLCLEIQQPVEDLIRDHVRLVAELAELADLGDRNVGQRGSGSTSGRRARSRRQRGKRVSQDVADSGDKVLRASSRADVDVVARGARDSRPIRGQRRGRAGSNLRLLGGLGRFTARQDRGDDDVIGASRNRAASRCSSRRRLHRTNSNREVVVLRSGANGDFGASVSGWIAHVKNSIDGALRQVSVVG